MLALDGIAFGYGSRAVLEDVRFTAGGGELVCVVGPNGAGKTTLLKVAAGLVRPSAGRVRLGELDPASAPRRLLARRLAYLPQDYALAFPFTVAEVVLMGRYPHHGAISLESADDERRASEAMRRCDVEDLAARRFDTLSGGERRRVLLAQAFCQEADALLLDEPTASLDPAHALAIFRILVEEKAARGALALVVTHDLNLAVRFADRVLVVDGGRLVADGPARAVLAATAAFGVSLHVGELPGGAPFAVPIG